MIRANILALLTACFFLGACTQAPITPPPFADTAPGAGAAATRGAESLFAQSCATAAPQVICVPVTVTAGASAQPTATPVATATRAATATMLPTNIVIEVTPLGQPTSGPAIAGMYTIEGSFINVRRGPGTAYTIAYAIQKSSGLDPFPVYASSGDGVIELWWAINPERTLWVAELHLRERVGSVQIKG